MKRIKIVSGALLTALSVATAQAQLSITSTGTVFTENFNGLGTGTGAIPGGFRAAVSTDWNSNGTTTGFASTAPGQTAQGGCYNFGNQSNTADRCLGFLNSGSFTSGKAINVKVVNNTGGPISGFTVTWNYEKYRSGSRQWDWTFTHGTASTSGTPAAAGNQSYPADANNTVTYPTPPSVAKSVTLTGLNIPNGGSYYFMWQLSAGGSSNGQALGIDDFTITATPGAVCTAPTTPASAITFPSVSSTSLGVSWTNGNGGGRVVMINTVNSFTAPTDGSNPSASTAYSGSGQQVVYNGAGSGPVTVTGLSAGSTYYFRVFEFCTPDRVYQTATGTDNPNSVETLPAITTTGSYAALCNQVASNINVTYTVAGSFTGTFTAQLSDAVGSFAAPTVIGTGASPIAAIIPAGMPAGTGYRIRVVNDNPAINGTPNGSNITISGLPSVNLGNDTAYCASSVFNLTLDAQNTGATYDWNSGAANTQTFTVDTAGTYTVQVTNIGGCVASDTLAVTENALPVVNLGNDTAYCAGSAFNLTLDAQNAGATYDWNSGAANTQTFAVDTAGTYSVTVTDANGCEGTDQLTVTENVLPVVELGNDTAYCAGTAFNLSLDAQNTGASYDWNSGAANTQTFTADTAGTYSVTVTDANGCENSDALIVTENALPVVNLGNDTAYCVGSVFNLMLDAQNAGASYDWNNGASNTQAFAADTAGTYSVTVTDANGCENSDVLTVTENALPAVALGNDTSYCAGIAFTLTLDAQNAGASYDWNSGAANTQTFVVDTAGTYSVTVTDVNGCENSDQLSVIENALPVTGLGNDTAYCAGTAFAMVLDAQPNGESYDWNNGAANTQTFAVDTAGTYFVVVTDDLGCQNSDTLTVTENSLPDVDIEDDTFYCIGTNFSLLLDAGNPGASYDWNNGGANTQTLTVDTAGTYFVTVTDANGCVNSDTSHITEKPLPVVSLGNDTAYCEGSAFSLVLDAGNPGASYSWNGGVATTQTYTVTAAGTYTVNVTDVFGCTNSADVEISENPQPDVNLGSDISTPNASQVLNAGSGFASYLWTPGNQITQQITVSQSGTYTVTVSSAQGCTASDTIQVTLNNNASISEAAVQPQISLYPNPAFDKFTVSLEYQGALQVDIISLNGQVLKSQKTMYQNQQALEIDVQNMAPGLYVVRFTGTDFTGNRPLIIRQ